jgi:hypothetical protein
LLIFFVFFEDLEDLEVEEEEEPPLPFRSESEEDATGTMGASDPGRLEADAAGMIGSGIALIKKILQ